MTILREFREFIARGNVIDLAVGVIIGAAFGKIVTSLVEQVVMPPIGLVLGRVDFAQLKWVLQKADPARKLAEVAIGYGAFLNTVIQFLIVALRRLPDDQAAQQRAPPGSPGPDAAAGAQPDRDAARRDPRPAEGAAKRWRRETRSMKQIDLDDLPPRVAQLLGSLGEAEELLLVQGGAVVARLVVADPAQPAAPDGLLADLPPEEQVKEVLEQFSAMINDEF